jgi:hypothetical protein
VNAQVQKDALIQEDITQTIFEHNVADTKKATAAAAAAAAAVSTTAPVRASSPLQLSQTSQLLAQGFPLTRGGKDTPTTTAVAPKVKF